MLRQCHTHFESSFFKAIVAFVVVKEIEHLVVGDKDVGQAVVVKVCDARRHAFSWMGTDSGLLGNVGESAVAVVHKQLACRFFI